MKQIHSNNIKHHVTDPEFHQHDPEKELHENCAGNGLES